MDLKLILKIHSDRSIFQAVVWQCIGNRPYSKCHADFVGIYSYPWTIFLNYKLFMLLTRITHLCFQNIDWTGYEGHVVQDYKSLIIHLVSAHTFYLKACLRMIVKHFIPSKSWFSSHLYQSYNRWSGFNIFKIKISCPLNSHWIYFHTYLLTEIKLSDNMAVADEGTRKEDEKMFHHLHNLLHGIFKLVPMWVLLNTRVRCYCMSSALIKDTNIEQVHFYRQDSDWVGVWPWAIVPFNRKMAH